MSLILLSSSAPSSSTPGSGGGSPSDVIILSLTVEHRYNGIWTDVSDDVLLSPSIEIRYGNWRRTLLSLIAQAGTCRYALRNDNGNLGGAQGYYSPGHANCHPFFRKKLAVRFTFRYNGVDYRKFTGTVWSIAPTPGVDGPQYTVVTAFDVMFAYNNAVVRQTPIFSDGSIVLASTRMAINAIASDNAIGHTGAVVDIDHAFWPKIFHDLGPNERAGAFTASLLNDSFSRFSVSGDGTLLYTNIYRGTTTPSSFHFDADSLLDVSVTTDPERSVNMVRGTMHPSRDGTTTVTVWSLPSETEILVQPRETRRFDVRYTDPEQPTTRVTALGVLNPVASTDYTANSAPDGSGTDLTADVTVTLSASYPSTGELTVVNTGSVDAYLIAPQVRGVLTYHDPEVTIVKDTRQADEYEQLVEFDTRYLQDPTILEGLVNILHEEGQKPRRIDEVIIDPHVSDDHMAAVLALEPGDLFTVTEDVTGLDAVKVRAEGVALTLEEGPLLTARVSTSEFLVNRFWMIGQARMGIDTMLGPY